MDNNEIFAILEENWSSILEKVKTDYYITDLPYNIWLKPLKLKRLDDNKLILLVPKEKQSAIKVIQMKYKDFIEIVLEETVGKYLQVSFELDRGDEDIRDESTNMILNENIEKANLNPRYTFESFVVGKNNELAHAAALAVADAPGEMYNPLFLYGGVGLGKTHLMHSIAHYILNQNPNAKVLYVTSEFFTIELIKAIRNSNSSDAMEEFRDKYRNIDVLLIDDIQFLIGKESTQEEFFHTFNHLYGLKKQIILSSDRPPKDMETLESRLSSRFEWGIMVDISSPDYETRMAILHKKEEIEGYNIDDEVLHFIASNIKSNIRELEGALNKLIAMSNLQKKDITLSLAEDALRDIITPGENRVLTPEIIIRTVAEHFNITFEDMVGSRRTANINNPRQIAMFLCRELTDTPLSAVGKILGNRDHSTIINGVDRITVQMEKNESMRNLVNTIKKKLAPL